MLKRLTIRFYRKPMSQSTLLFCDVLMVVAFFFICKLVNYQENFPILFNAPEQLLSQFLIVLAVYIAVFLVFKPYKSIMRYTGFGDIQKVFYSSAAAFGILSVIKIVTYFYKPLQSYFLWGRELLPLVALVLVGMAFIRLFSRFVYDNIMDSRKKETRRIVIYGAGDAGKLTYNVLAKDSSLRNRIVAFADDNPDKHAKQLNSVPIYPSQKVFNEKFIQNNAIDELIIAIPSIRLQTKQDIIKKAMTLNLNVKSVPDASQWTEGTFSANQIKNIKIEDLLARDPIVLDNSNIRNEIDGKVILVSGAAGSIGSELSRQLCQYSAKKLIFLDNAESPLFDLQFEIRNKFTNKDIEFVIADIRDMRRINEVFDRFAPETVYHAAAYKHVPFMEENPYEAVSVNVFGTKNIADAAISHKVGKFVMVSTDKAVNPTNVMGATKRVAEIYTQSHTNETTHFITTRFGNVLGSSGSVIPLFKKQLEQGGPLTITHRDITRYFMTIPEACNLVLEASSMGTGGDIFVFDMGKPVKIYDLAKNMIRLSHLDNIEIKEIGLRPGEKLYEELLATKENTLPTHHPKILRAKVRSYDPQSVDDCLQRLSVIEKTSDVFRIVAEIKSIVPEFISNNSVFSSLDKKSEKPF
ncbi:MAG: polysaccharide biosynthesis protein [Bacteroidales bacterium]|nr:polysaccharide biosynthesis protein [Bacteroidales bacterium]